MLLNLLCVVPTDISVIPTKHHISTSQTIFRRAHSLPRKQFQVLFTTFRTTHPACYLFCCVFINAVLSLSYIMWDRDG